MILRKHIGHKYMTATTRRANHSEFYYGKLTLWKSELDYGIGNCDGAITFTNLFLGKDKSKFSEIFEMVAKNILVNRI